MRLIDADKLKKSIPKTEVDIFENCRYCTLLSDEQVLEMINKQPTVEERKKGKWIFRTVFPNDKSEFPMGYLECSICGSTHVNKTPCNFCDNCGAKMEEDDETD